MCRKAKKKPKRKQRKKLIGKLTLSSLSSKESRSSLHLESIRCDYLSKFCAPFANFSCDQLHPNFSIHFLPF